MSTSYFSPSWHRVAALTPRLRNHIKILRHHYRGELWYVLQDPASLKSNRLTPAANYLIGLMDGKRNVQEIWDIATERLGDDAPAQDDTIQLLSQLHSADALHCDVPPDTSELLRRRDKDRRNTWKRRIMNPMALRVPLFDPDRFLNRFESLARPVFSWIGLIVWLAVAGSAVVLAGAHWSDLTENLTDQVLAPHNLLLIGFLFPLVKAVHEFGHAFAVKVWGGEVHEMGVMFLVFVPVPYVDASAASAFRDKRKRVVVGAAGMIVELFVAALAMFVWLNVEPGATRAVAYNVIIIASVSTLLFNINPLLRFDGYYILSDLIEIQNLGTRANKYLGYLIQRHVYRLSDLEPPPSTPGEVRWFVGYGICSFIYRMFIVTVIVMFVANKFFFIGVLLAIWAIAIMIVVPLVKNAAKLFSNPRIRPRRARAIATTVSLVGLVVALTLIPVPSWTRAEGTIWLPGELVVRAGYDGFVEEVLVPPGSYVRRGTPLIVCRNKELATSVELLKARLAELEMHHRAQLPNDRVKAEIVRDEMKTVAADLAVAQTHAADLIIRAQTDGKFVLPSAQDLPGRFVRRGELIAYTLDLSTVTARVVVPQQDIDMVRQYTRRVDVRLAEQVDTVVSAVPMREIPAATDELPGMALAQQGGGDIAIDPRGNQGAKAFQKFFQLDVEFPLSTDRVNVGGRVYVRFDHGLEPLAHQWYRGLRQLFLTQFNV